MSLGERIFRAGSDPCVGRDALAVEEVRTGAGWTHNRTQQTRFVAWAEVESVVLIDYRVIAGSDRISCAC